MRRRRLSTLFAIAFLLVFGRGGVKAGEHTSPRFQRFVEVKEYAIPYRFNRIIPEKADLPLLDSYAELAKTDPDIRVSIITYVPQGPSVSTGIPIPKRRVDVIKQHFIKNGVDVERIIVDFWNIDASTLASMSEWEREQFNRTTVRLIRRVSGDEANPPQVKHAENPKSPRSIQDFGLPGTDVPKTESPVAEPEVVAEEQAPPVEKVEVALVEEPSEVVEPLDKGAFGEVVKLPDSAAALSSPKVEEPTGDVEPAGDELVEKSVDEPVAEEDELRPEAGMQTARFVDVLTGAPVEVDLDYKSPEGKASVSSGKDGVVRIPLAGLASGKVDVYAYGYFFVSEKLDMDDTAIQEVGLTPIEGGGTLRLTDIYFASGSPELLPESLPELKRLSRALGMNPSVRIEVGGHINVPFLDPADLSKEQVQLSANRAKAVCDYLEGEGIDTSRLSFKGYGNSQMVYPIPATEEERAMNRRVEIKILD